MLNCSFAEKFHSDGTIAKNFGTITGTVTVSSGATAAGGNIAYDVVTQPGGFSVVVRWSASAAVSVDSRLLYNSALLHAGTAGTGFSLWLTADGIKANCSTATTAETALSVDLDYADGETHTATYIVDMAGGAHSLYVDLLSVDTDSISLNEEIGSVVNVFNTETTGVTLYRAVIMDGLLEEADHDVYYAGTLTSFAKKPYAVYPCDAFCNDTDGNKIWDKTTNLRDLYKADRSDSAKFPDFETDKYFFDDFAYVGNLSLPATQTNTSATSNPIAPWPTVEQYDDGTFTDKITTSGEYWGYLHSMGLHSGGLSQLQKLQDKYNHLYWLWRGRAYGAYHRLITEDTCKLAMFLDAGTDVFQDYSLTPDVGIAEGVTRDGANGCTFPNSSSNIRFEDQPSRRIKNGTIAFYGTFDTPKNGNFISKLENYELLVAFGTTLRFIGTSLSISDFTHTISDNEFIAVTFKDGERPRLNVDGDFVELGSAAITVDDTATNDLYVGNYYVKSYNCQYPLKQVYVGDEPLTDAELNALYEQMKVTGATPMEAGNRKRIKNTFTGAVVDVDIDPGGPFQLIEVQFLFDAAPTTSEDITVKTIDAGDDPFTEHKIDPSLSAELTHTIRFDKRISDNIKVAVDYANTDANTIKVVVVYQMDQNVV
jgi:hypothetical protein